MPKNKKTTKPPVRRTTIEELRIRVDAIMPRHDPDHYEIAEKVVIECAKFIAQEAAAIDRVLAGHAEPVSTCACSFSEIEEANRIMQSYAARAVAIEDFEYEHAAKKKREKPLVCAECGKPGLQYPAWVGSGDPEINDVYEAYSGYYCSSCDEHNVEGIQSK